LREINYIDPGTGGMIVGSLWQSILVALTAVAGVLLRIFWNPIKRMASRLKKKGRSNAG